MRGTWRGVLGLMVASTALAGGEARADALFASPPHFLTLRDRAQIVLFVNEPVVGALASRPSERTIEVIVPRALVDPTLRGTSFHGDAGAGVEVTELALAPAARGNASIRIQTAEHVGGIHAYSDVDPPRLVIDLLATAPTPEPTPGAPTASPPRATTTVARSAAVPSATVTRTPAATAVRTASPYPDAPAATHARTQAAASATPAATSARPHPTATITVASPRAPVPSARATAARTRASLGMASLGEPANTPLAAPAPVGGLGPDLSGREARTDGVQIRTAIVGGIADGAIDAGCRWRPVSGVGFCAPDPTALPYAVDPALTALATGIADGRAALPEPAGDGPAALYLAADRVLVTRAADGRLLPAVEAYRHALRRAPGFVDAARARMNVALAYRAMEFTTELQSAAPADDPVAALAAALLGDVLREQGSTAAARASYEQAAAGRGLGPCLATRGRAALAVAAGDVPGADAEVDALATRCPAALVHDPETEQVRARVQLAAGDARGALVALEALQGTLGARGAPWLLLDVAAAAEAAGDLAAARRAYAQLVKGPYGAQVAARGTIALARLDAERGDVATGLQRLRALDPALAVGERRAFGVRALENALARGADQEAVTLVHEQGIAVDALAPELRIRLARSYRTLGLHPQAADLLASVRTAAGPTTADAVEEERGALALARGDAPAALAIADEWLRARGVEAPPAADVLRARALAQLGEGAAARALVAERLAGADPLAVRALRVELADAVRPRDPASALALIQEALAMPGLPELAPERAAQALRTLAEAAESAGDDAAALQAFTALATRYGDQPSAAGAAYRVARLSAGQGNRGAGAAYAEVARSRDPVERRVGAAAQAYEAIIIPFEGLREER